MLADILLTGKIGVSSGGNFRLEAVLVIADGRSSVA